MAAATAGLALAAYAERCAVPLPPVERYVSRLPTMPISALSNRAMSLNPVLIR